MPHTRHMTNSLHAHISYDATDCDGRISRDYVYTMNDDEQNADAFGDLRFHARVMDHIANPYAVMHATIEISRKDDGETVVTVRETTDEGGRSYHAEFCTMDCDTDESGYRDHRAESMGY
jgi:hypothetical protein